MICKSGYHLRICVSAFLRDNKITQNKNKTINNHEIPSENNDQRLKIKVPAGSNAYLRGYE